MIDRKKIEPTENAPSGIMLLQSGGLAIDMGLIKSISAREKFYCIDYHDGARVEWYPATKQDDQL